MAGQLGFFDLSDRYEALSVAGDPLERLSGVVDFELFRGPLVAALLRGPRNKGVTTIRPGADVQNPGPASLIFAVR